MAFMLLSSAMPFYGANRMKTIKRILNNKYAFRGKRWNTISTQAKEFIQQLLVPDPEERLDAEAALQSAWLQQEGVANHANGTTEWMLSAEEEEMVRACLLKYARYPKLKKMVFRYRHTCVDTHAIPNSHTVCDPYHRHSWSWLISPAAMRLVSYVNSLRSTILDTTDPFGLKSFASR